MRSSSSPVEMINHISEAPREDVSKELIKCQMLSELNTVLETVAILRID